jgi:thiol-disulfide isomerase/thioredoxin
MNNNNNKMENKSGSSKVILILVAAVLIISGITAFAVSNNMKMEEQKKKDSEKVSSMMSKSADTMMSKSGDVMMSKSADSMTTMMSTPGDYKPYTESELVHAKEGHHVIIFFNASWCPTCQSTVKDIEANLGKIAPNTHILSADYDKETALKQKYGVTMQHTFVEVNAKGDLLNKVSGLGTVDAINAYLK